jgi:hypothetical protein
VTRNGGRKIPATMRVWWMRTRGRREVLAFGYVAVAIFIGAIVTVRYCWPDVPWPIALTVAAVIASPVALALIWNRVTNLRLFSLEITLREFAVFVDQDIAADVQDQRSSGTKALVFQIGEALEKQSATLLEINLRNGKYWWPTRLFLLAALADDYMKIDQIVFVEGAPDRRYIGMATPRAVRKGLSEAFTEADYEAKYSKSQGYRKPTDAGSPLRQKISDICFAWEEMFGGIEAEEHSIAGRFIDRSRLQACLGKELDGAFVPWDGLVTPRLQCHVLFRPTPYTPLVQDGLLKEVASRTQLAVRIAESALAGRR